MSKSFDWCIDRAQNSPESMLRDRPWHDAYEVAAEEFFDSRTNGLRDYDLDLNLASGDKYQRRIKLTFAKEADFQYFSSEELVHDGTLVFYIGAIEEVVLRVFMGTTYYLPNGKPPEDAIIHYTIGDFVVLDEYADDGTKFSSTAQPWMHSRTTVLLPLRCDYEYEENK